MRLLMNDLKLNSDRATLKRVLEHAVPQTLQDVVIVYAAVAGKQDGELREENYVNKIYPQMIAGRLWSAIQVTTAAGITAVVDLVMSSPRKYQGFIAQEQFDAAGNSRQSFWPVLRAGRHQGHLLGGRGQRPGRASAQERREESRRGQAEEDSEAKEMSAAKAVPVQCRRRRHSQAARHRFDQRRCLDGQSGLVEGHRRQRHHVDQSDHW